MSELFLRLVFSYAVGNSDMHLRIFSAKKLIQSVAGRLNGHIDLCRASFMPNPMKEKPEALMVERCGMLDGSRV